jgi:hypothetical protein
VAPSRRHVVDALDRRGLLAFGAVDQPQIELV